MPAPRARIWNCRRRRYTVHCQARSVKEGRQNPRLRFGLGQDSRPRLEQDFASAKRKHGRKKGFLMLSVIFCSRAKDNPDSYLRRLLDSAVDYTTPEERKQIEFLIKFDHDDELRPPKDFARAYPFRIKTFEWSRGEGRHSLHHAQEYMFAQRDPRSRFCLMTADDFYFTRGGFVSEILNIRDEFVIIGQNRPNIESYAGIY